MPTGPSHAAAPSRPRPPDPPEARIRLTGGVVAHNEERTLAEAVRSLTEQRLPAGVSWERICLVASGCTDRTVEIAGQLAATDPRVRVVVEARRRGKAAALDRVLGSAGGGPVILLNADARAEPDAVARLLASASSERPPLAVMARPVPPAHVRGPAGRISHALWALHHEFHRATLADGRGNHLSDELLLVHAPGFPGFPEGVINDGAFLGAWLDANGGVRKYSPEARVAIQIPGTLSDYLSQRRRILAGHAQVRELAGTRPTTLPQLARSDPVAAARIIGRVVRSDPALALDLAAMIVPEALASLLAAWDRLPPRRDHGRWERIRHPVGWS